MNPAFVSAIDLGAGTFEKSTRIPASFAAFADGADEALGLEAADDAGEQEGLDAHVEQARDAADGVIRVQRGQHQMPG